jgi:hypothetical protein
MEIFDVVQEPRTITVDFGEAGMATVTYKPAACNAQNLTNMHEGRPAYSNNGLTEVIDAWDLTVRGQPVDPHDELELNRLPGGAQSILKRVAQAIVNDWQLQQGGEHGSPEVSLEQDRE